ncbi:energy-coupling factor ABC transporter ATP-binding protein [Thermogladius sp. 4427co]|uniref:energy-coupling factor ABC transporter ATP-binding protein n=1 Tax=Thermogladius sp. 4427co TaxID=3450718 RepID=UPI003F7A813F
MEIALEKIWHAYDGVNYVLRDVSIAFERPGIYLVIGPNGAGKTTLLKILSLIIRPSRGMVLVDGRDFWGLDRESRELVRKSFSYVHDKPILVRGTVEDNIMLGLRYRGRVSDDIVEYYIERYGLREIRGRNAARLSAGQAKAVSIVRALVLEPRVLALDEPFTYLDPTRTLLLIDDIKKMVEEKKSIVIIATHYMYRELLNIAVESIEIVGGEIISRIKRG